MPTPEEAIAIARARGRAGAPGVVDTGIDVAKSGGSGFLESLSEMPDLNPITPLLQMGTKALGLPDELYSTRAIVEDIAPGSTTYEPKTTLGKFARPVGNAAAGLAFGPGNLAKKGIMSLTAGVTSEGAGELAQKFAPTWEPLARALGMVVGGVGSSSIKSKAGIGSDVVISAAKKVAKSPTTPDPEKLKAVTKGLYDSLDGMGVNYDMYSWQGFGQRVHNALTRSQHYPSDAPTAFQKAAEWTQEAMTKGPPSFMDLERRSQVLGGLIRDAYKQGNNTVAHALDIVRRELNDFALNTPMSTTMNAPISVITKVRGLARSLALKSIKQRRMEEIMEDAMSHPDGIIAGLKQEVTRALKSKSDKALFNENERVLLKAVRDGSKPVNALARFGLPRMVLMPVGGVMTGGAIGTAMTLSPAAGAAVALGGTAALGAATARAKLPGIAASRFEAAKGAMRNTAKEQGKGNDFDTEFKMQKLEKNRRRIRQLMLIPPAANQLENDDGQP